MSERGIPLAAMQRILEDAGAKRISDDAKEALREIAEARIAQISEKAGVYAQHAGRKTIKEEDVQLALEDVR